jgi:Luciferase-like monooxygenase
MPIEFSTTIRCQWKQGEPDGIASTREKIGSLPSNFTTIWIADHLQQGTQVLLESWTTLSYLAAEFPRFTYGHLVDCQSFRNPGLLAKMGATLQYLTGGRFIMGLGRAGGRRSIAPIATTSPAQACESRSWPRLSRSCVPCGHNHLRRTVGGITVWNRRTASRVQIP